MTEHQPRTPMPTHDTEQGVLAASLAETEELVSKLPKSLEEIDEIVARSRAALERLRKMEQKANMILLQHDRTPELEENAKRVIAAVRNLEVSILDAAKKRQALVESGERLAETLEHERAAFQATLH